jgi:hypothetical protein
MTFGTVPFGYRWNAYGGLDPQPGESEIVYEIAGMRANGAKLADIACQLTSANVPTRRGGKWSAEQAFDPRTSEDARPAAASSERCLP